MALCPPPALFVDSHCNLAHIQGLTLEEAVTHLPGMTQLDHGVGPAMEGAARVCKMFGCIKDHAYYACVCMLMLVCV